MKLEDMMLSETSEKDEYWVIYAEPKKKKSGTHGSGH